MIISIVHSNSHITERITNILDYHLHHPYTISNTLIPADLCFTDTLEDIPRIRNINKKAFIVIVTNHPLGPETVIYQPFYYIFEDSLEKDIPFCKSQYKNVGLGQYKNVGFPTFLYCLFSLHLL